MSLRINDIAPDFEAETSQGKIKFHDWLGNSWGVLFSHPKDFTPVCTTELGYMAKIKPEFDKRNVKIMGLSVDPVTDHARWANDIKETQGTAPNYPIIGDADFKVSKLYGMLPAEVSGDPCEAQPGRQPDGAQRLRRRPGQEDQAHPDLSDDDGTEFRRSPARDRFHAANRQASRGDAGQLETGPGRDHHRSGLRRRGGQALSGLQEAETLSAHHGAAQVAPPSRAMTESAQKLATGNRLRDGVPVYFAGEGKWSPQVMTRFWSRRTRPRHLLEEAQRGEKPLPAVGVELIEAVREGARIVPVTLREKIRAFGPTVPHG